MVAAGAAGAGHQLTRGTFARSLNMIAPGGTVLFFAPPNRAPGFFSLLYSPVSVMNLFSES
jgi:hypothetical protein